MIKKHSTNTINISGILIGGSNPVVVQSMTNTDTADITATVAQIIELAEAGSELVRITVNNEAAAKAVPHIHEKLLAKNYAVPLVGDFHYNGHRLLADFPDCAEALAKYRVNPGNVGFGQKRDPQFAAIIETAIKYNKPIRIGINWGSLDEEISTRLMDENSKKNKPASADEIMREAMIQSALISAKKAEEIGLAADKIILSTKVSRVQDLIAIYRELARRSNYALHLGLTEAGMGSKGIVASTAALAVLLQEGIGDTIRISLTPEPRTPRAKEVTVAQEILQSMGLRDFRPSVTACPGCGRTTSTLFQELAAKVQGFLDSRMVEWKKSCPEAAKLKVAVMGCIVNGPGESKHADIGISLPGTGESPVAPVFIDGRKAHTLRGDKIAEEFIVIVDDYVAQKQGSGAWSK